MTTIKMQHREVPILNFEARAPAAFGYAHTITGAINLHRDRRRAEEFGSSIHRESQSLPKAKSNQFKSQFSIKVNIQFEQYCCGGSI
jgi:hypothetical protein